MLVALLAACCSSFTTPPPFPKGPSYAFVQPGVHVRVSFLTTTNATEAIVDWNETNGNDNVARKGRARIWKDDATGRFLLGEPLARYARQRGVYLSSFEVEDDQLLATFDGRLAFTVPLDKE